MADRRNGDTPAGLAFGLAAYGLWGVIALYFRLLVEYDNWEVLAQRAVWCFLFLAAAIMACGLMGDVRRAVRDRRTMSTLCASAVLIGINWFAFIYAVATRQVVEAGLGYFITPLLNVLLGVAVLGERLRPLQLAAVVVAAVGTILLAMWTGRVPWLAIILATSFSMYGLLRKITAAEAMVGLFIETALLLPAAIIYVGYLTAQGRGVIALHDLRGMELLALSGPVTMIPLVCFSAAARRLRLTTLGFMQFLAPSMQMLVAVYALGETVGAERLQAFAIIWTAVGLYLVDAVWTRRRVAPAIIDLPE